MFDRVRLGWRLWDAHDRIKSAVRAAQEKNMGSGKSLVTSKTLWINVIGTLIQIVPTFAQFVPQPYGVLLLGVVNVINRLFTSQPITGITVS